MVGHHVTAMVVQAEAGLVADPQRAFRTIGELGRKALTGLHHLCAPARPRGTPDRDRATPALDIDGSLPHPLRRPGVEVDAAIGDDLGADEPDLTAYRIVQEALTNVARHAQARQSGSS